VKGEKSKMATAPGVVIPDAVSSAPVPGSTEDKVDQATAVAGAVAEGFAPKYASVIAEGVELEPVAYHLVSFLIHLFKKPKQ
jgi:hypothetical protein